jgi:hypothetical protein
MGHHRAVDKADKADNMTHLERIVSRLPEADRVDIHGFFEHVLRASLAHGDDHHLLLRGDVRVLDGALEERLQADADAHEGLAGVDVLAEGGDVAGLGELGEAVAEVAYAGEDELL